MKDPSNRAALVYRNEELLLDNQRLRRELDEARRENRLLWAAYAHMPTWRTPRSEPATRCTTNADANPEGRT